MNFRAYSERNSIRQHPKARKIICQVQAGQNMVHPHPRSDSYGTKKPMSLDQLRQLYTFKAFCH